MYPRNYVHTFLLFYPKISSSVPLVLSSAIQPPEMPCLTLINFTSGSLSVLKTFHQLVVVFLGTSDHDSVPIGQQ